MTDKRKWLTVALEGGAKIARDTNTGYFYILDQLPNWMGGALFISAEVAALAFCDHYRLPWSGKAAGRGALLEAYRLTGDVYYKDVLEMRAPKVSPDYSFWLGRESARA